VKVYGVYVCCLFSFFLFSFFFTLHTLIHYNTHTTHTQHTHTPVFKGTKSVANFWVGFNTHTHNNTHNTWPEPARQKDKKTEPSSCRGYPALKRTFLACGIEVVKRAPVQPSLPKQQDKRPCAKSPGRPLEPSMCHAHTVKRQEKDRIVYKEIEDARIETNRTNGARIA